MNLIIFTGPPASGKSSLAECCSKVLNIPWYSKDRYKVTLYEKFGFTNHSKKKALSVQGERLLMQTVEEYCKSDDDVIIDNNFKNFDALRQVLMNSEYRCHILCIFLYAENVLLAKRYNERITSGNRELPLYVLNQYPVIDGVTEFHKPLTPAQVEDINQNVTEEMFGDCKIRIDTNQLETQFDAILKRVLRFISDNIKDLERMRKS